MHTRELSLANGGSSQTAIAGVQDVFVIKHACVNGVYVKAVCAVGRLY
jgi:hypothetical protein